MRALLRAVCAFATLFTLSSARVHADQIVPKPAEQAAALPQSIGARYNLTQVAQPVGDGRFVVGRWDGSLQLWRLSIAGPPSLLDTALLPSREGVQALAGLGDGRVVCSHDGGSLSVWTVVGDRIERLSLVDHPGSLGMATTATLITVGGKQAVAVGHETGMISVWRIERWGLSLLATLDVRSPHPVPSPYPLRHVRGLVQTPSGLLVSGSEDGDLALIQLGPSLDVARPEVVSRSRYSQTAKRGINGFALRGDLLAVTNCAVGKDDANVHLWRVSSGRLLPVQSLLLKSDPQLDQVFSFAATWSSAGSEKLWVTTQEGLLWQLSLTPSDKSPLRVEGKLSVASRIGAALLYDKERKLLVAVGHEATVLKVP